MGFHEPPLGQGKKLSPNQWLSDSLSLSATKPGAVMHQARALPQAFRVSVYGITTLIKA